MKKTLLLVALIFATSYLYSEDPPPHTHSWELMADWIDSYNSEGHVVASGYYQCKTGHSSVTKPGSGSKTRRSHTLSGETIAQHNDSQHVITQDCTATGYDSSCGYTKTTYVNHTKAWVGTTYKCTDNCGWVDSENSAKAAAVKSAYDGIKGDAIAAKGEAIAAKSKSSESEVQSGLGDDDWLLAEGFEGEADQEGSNADGEASDALQGKADVDLFNENIATEEQLARTKTEMNAQASYCSICGEKLVAGNPVNVVSGAKIEHFSDLEIHGPGDHIHAERYYNNQIADALSFGQGFQFNYDSRIIFGVKIRAQEAYDLAVREYDDAVHNLFMANIYIQCHYRL